MKKKAFDLYIRKIKHKQYSRHTNEPANIDKTTDQHHHYACPNGNRKYKTYIGKGFSTQKKSPNKQKKPKNKLKPPNNQRIS